MVFQLQLELQLVIFLFFSVTVTIIINLFDIFQLRLQLIDFSVAITVTDPVIKS